MSGWDSTQYLKFERERTQPARDLARRLSCTAPGKVLDLGCGPGNSTGVLRDRFPAAQITGADNSPAMIERAKRDYPELEFRLFDATDDFAGLGTQWDVIFSNACLQWVPDHRALLPRLLASLRQGGELAVQIPLQPKAPVHRLLQELTAAPEWKSYLFETRPFHLLDELEYCEILAGHASDYAMWETDYCHIFDSYQAIVEWYRGTGLRPYLDALPEEKKSVFERQLLDGVEKSFPQLADGSVVFRFARLFFTAVR